MSDLFQNAPPYIQALIAGIITWLLTALGAAAVFIFKKVNDKVLNSMQGFAHCYNPQLNRVKIVLCHGFLQQ